MTPPLDTEGMTEAHSLTGYPCPKCGSAMTVYCTRRQDTVDGTNFKRYRKCGRCQHNLVTVEIPVIQERD